MTKELTLQDLIGLDLTVPRERLRVGDAWVSFKFKRIEDQSYYVPSFISWNGTARPGWRVRMDRSEGFAPAYFSAAKEHPMIALEKAWEYVVRTLMGQPLKPKPLNRPKKSLNTGMTGVRLWMAKPDDPRTFMIRVGQSIESDRAHNEIFYSVARDGLDRKKFEGQYRRAVAARRYYEFLRESHWRLAQPITRDTAIPDQFYPDALPVPNLYDELCALVAS